MSEERDVQVGHWTSSDERTGCTAIIFPEGTVASGEVRGGAPATREFALLDPRRTVQHIDAVVLSGGSAFGLATAHGVMQYLHSKGRGFPTRSGPVPIVVAMALFDLAADVEPPGVHEGFHAAVAAGPGIAHGRVGAGAGATVGSWRGVDHQTAGGLGLGRVKSGSVEVTALVAVNPAGDIDDGATQADVLAGRFVEPERSAPEFENTTIGVIWTNAYLDKLGCKLVAESGHDGLGRALIPAHTAGDGDALVAASTGQVEATSLTVRLLAAMAVEQAVRSVEATS